MCIHTVLNSKNIPVNAYETDKLVRNHLIVLQTNSVSFLHVILFLVVPYIVFAVDCRGNILEDTNSSMQSSTFASPHGTVIISLFYLLV
jgi:hypothetical protein